jgi:Tfp pilus assembly protein PilV
VTRIGRCSADRGFTIVESLVTLAFVSALTAGLSGLLVVAIRSSNEAKSDTVASFLATWKIEQLRSLVASSASFPLSSTGVLDTNVPGFFDLADAEGRVVGETGSTRASFSRRWSIRGHPADPLLRFVLEVRVVDLQSRDVMLTTVVSRR